MKKTVFFLFAFSACLFSCTVPAPEDVRPEGSTLTFTASFEGNDETRTVLDGTHVLWKPNDAIKVCYNGHEACFRNNLTEPSPVCDFTGILQSFSEFGAPDGKTEFGAIYPYYYHGVDNHSYFYDGWFEDLRVPNEQEAVEGSFDGEAFPSIAKTLDSHLYFRNLCGGVILRFSAGCENYARVIFRANGLEPLSADDINVTLRDFNDGKGEVPYDYEMDYAYPEVALKAPDGGFKPGVDYYLSLLPCPLRAGFSLAFVNKDGTVAVKKYPGAQEIKRSVFGRPGVLDTDLAWKGYSETVANPAAIEQQWVFTDTDGKDYIFDVGKSIPGYTISYPADSPVFTKNGILGYTLKQGLFDKIEIHLTRNDCEFFDVTALTANSMSYRYFYPYLIGEDPYPSEKSFLLSGSTVTPEYGGLWIEVDGTDYDLNISSDYPGMYVSFKAIADAHGGNLPIVYLNNYGTPADYSGVDVRGKVAVVKRGSNSFGEKVTAAADAGAVGILIVNNQSGIVNCNVEGKTQIPHASLLQEVGPKLAGKTSVPCFQPTLSQIVASL